MWQFICGFGTGIYVGTIYNCRPCLKTVEKFLKENLPKEKTDNDNEKGKNDEKQWKTNEKNIINILFIIFKS